MSKNVNLAILILLIMVFCQCGSDSEPARTTELVKPVRILDISNENNASDLMAVFTITDLTQVEAIRIALVPTAEFPDFDSKKGANLGDNQFFSPPVSGQDYQVRFPASLTDVNGNSIQNNQSYTLAILLNLAGDWALNTLTDEITPADRHFLEGRYVGLWNDNLYLDFGISTELKFQAGKLRGAFYYSPTFVPCCGGEDDGTLTIEVIDNLVTEFRYNQTLDSFMGGPCPGLYTGTGTVENFITLRVDFSGDDCEGPHTGGSIVLTRIE
ncbi:MAG: hypothetical protein D6714_13380 [Bacteroidetes bacterium]|nr:MAG: hypothetical protein D6714_13380 [Bacteroidota bacterium]